MKRVIEFGGVVLFVAAVTLCDLRAQGEERDSSMFNHQYNGDLYPVPNYMEDLNGSGWATDPETDGDILTFRMSGSGPFFKATDWAPNHNVGYTIEFRLKLDEDFDDAGAGGVIALYYGDGTAGDVFSVGRNVTKAALTSITVDTNSNTDGFHTFRIAQGPGTPTPIDMYRDGELVYQFPNGGNWASAIQYFGSGGSFFGGATVHLDYLRWDDTGAYAPIGSTPHVLGDTDGDGDVDIDDVNNVQNNLGLNANGDADDDGDTDQDDYHAVRDHFGEIPTGSGSVSAVPEPSAWMLSVLGGIGLCAWRCRLGHRMQRAFQNTDS